MPMPTVPRPLSHIISSHSKPNLNNCDSRFGFRLPPQPRILDTLVPPLTANSSNVPFNSSVVKRLGESPIASIVDANGNRVPIDPVLLAESQSQPSFHSLPVVYHSLSAKVRQRQRPQGPTPLNPFTGDQSEGQVTSIDVHTSGTLQADSDSGGDSNDDGMDESEVEYEFDGSNSSDDELEPSHSQVRVRNSFPINDGSEFDTSGYQNIGTEYSVHHDLHDPLLGAFCYCKADLELILFLQSLALIDLHPKMSNLPMHSYVLPVSTSPCNHVLLSQSLQIR